jgi:hypothetical protein
MEMIFMVMEMVSLTMEIVFMVMEMAGFNDFCGFWSNSAEKRSFQADFSGSQRFATDFSVACPKLPFFGHGQASIRAGSGSEIPTPPGASVPNV